MIITHNGEGKMVVQDIESFEAMTRAVAMLKILAMGRKEIERGKGRPAREAIASIRKRRRHART